MFRKDSAPPSAAASQQCPQVNEDAENSISDWEDCGIPSPWSKRPRRLRHTRHTSQFAAQSRHAAFQMNRSGEMAASAEGGASGDEAQRMNASWSASSARRRHPSSRAPSLAIGSETARKIGASHGVKAPKWEVSPRHVIVERAPFGGMWVPAGMASSQTSSKKTPIPKVAGMCPNASPQRNATKRGRSRIPRLMVKRANDVRTKKNSPATPW